MIKDRYQNRCLYLYTHVRNWLPEINKQKFTHPPELEVGVAIGGVAVEAEFVHCGGSADYYVYQKACYTGLPNISTTVCISNRTKSQSELSADLTGMNVEVGVNIVLFISGSHL